MIVWKSRNIAVLNQAELRLALEDAADEIIRARSSFGSDQVFAVALSGFITGAIAAATALTAIYLSQ